MLGPVKMAWAALCLSDCRIADNQHLLCADFTRFNPVFNADCPEMPDCNNMGMKRLWRNGNYYKGYAIYSTFSLAGSNFFGRDVLPQI